MSETRFTSVESHPAKKTDFVRILAERDLPFTRKDLTAYADEVIAAIKKLPRREAVKYIVRGLETPAIINRFWKNRTPLWKKIKALFSEEADREIIKERETIIAARAELLHHIDRARNAFVEVLKEKISDDPELADVHLGDVFVLKGAVNKENVRVGRTSDAYGRGHIIKEELSYGSEELSRKHEEALRRLEHLPKSEYILPLTHRDSVLGQTLAAETDLKTVSSLIEEGAPTAEKLRVVLDCMEGAEFLREHGLVLQDISHKNLGVVERNGRSRGVLFDLEGLMPAGTRMSLRFHTDEYLPPEVRSGNVPILLPSEMVYQFGVVLRKIFYSVRAEIDDQARKDFEQLIERMKYVDLASRQPVLGRMDLPTAIRKLEAIVRSFAERARRAA